MRSDLVEQVKLRYKQSLVEKADKLETLWTKYKHQPDELSSFLHQLAGSAGMYGYDDITEQSISLRKNLTVDPIEQHQDQFEKLYQLLIKSAK